MEPEDNEVECPEVENVMKLTDLEKLLPELKRRYGARSVIRFGGVVISPTNMTRNRGECYR